MRSRPGELNPKAKLTVADVLTIRASQEPQLTLARRYGVGPDTIWSIRARKTWNHIPDRIRTTPSSSTERWRRLDIPRFTQYEVSSLGRIRRAAANLPQPLRKYRTSRQGYAVCVLSSDNKQRQFFVHVLVARMFLGFKPSGHQVNHKDGNKQNNSVDNLEYVTPQQNRIHAARVLGYGIGEHNGRAKLTTEQVLSIRTNYAETAASIARRYGVHKSTVDRIRQGVMWTHATPS